MSYLPIADYGIIGNMHTVALVGIDASIDWLCLPNFDSPSVFGALLDSEKGGHFRIAPTDPHVVRKQLYWPDTNILVTRFFSPDGVGEVRDYMPVGPVAHRRGFHGLLRQVSVVRGSMAFRMECRPAFNYALDQHETEVLPDGASFISDRMSLGLTAAVPLRRDGRGVAGEFTLEEDQTTAFVLQQIDPRNKERNALPEAEIVELFRDTVAYWRSWLAKCSYRGRWRETVHRSALALKLLTYEPTGAIVAAPTTSLPENMGGGRNWDYRYTWIRDAAFTLYALLRIGFTEEASAFMGWLEARCKELPPGEPLQTMYAIDGSPVPPEVTLDHLDGYRGSRPVRIGNGAANQLQLDIYGALMDSIYLFNKYGTPISYDLWTHLRRLTNWLCEHWAEPDEGIWEVRGGRQHFVYSKTMCWVALDRALRLADRRSFPADRERWLNVRDEIYEEIMLKGWSEHRRAFVQSYGSERLDAANLIMPLVFFLSPSDPRMLSTLDAINSSVKRDGLVSNGLVYRYDAGSGIDAIEGEEGTFNICTFWLVEGLIRAGRADPARLNDARLMFEQMLGYATNLGLYAEQTGRSGESLGNFPQAFTHLALISAAFNLDRALGRGN